MCESKEARKEESHEKEMLKKIEFDETDSWSKKKCIKMKKIYYGNFDIFLQNLIFFKQQS
jgi:hypothetical protein